MNSVSEKAAMLDENGFAEDWEQPIPFDSMDVPAFPLAALPGPVREFVAALAESTQTPSEMGGLLALGVLATASQRLYEVEITSDWREPLGLYAVAGAVTYEIPKGLISIRRPTSEAQRQALRDRMLKSNPFSKSPTN